MTGPLTPPSRQIVLSSRDELHRLCRQFACDEAELLHAVWKAGPDADSVRAFLDRRLQRTPGATNASGTTARGN